MTTESPPDRARQLRDQGIAALRAGQRGAAQEYLAQAVELNPRDEQAWLWLAGAADSDEDRRFCLQQVLALNPASSAARNALAALGPAPQATPVAAAPTIPLAAAPTIPLAQPAPEPPPPPVTAAAFAPSAEFQFPSLAEWKSIWYGVVMAAGGALVTVGRRFAFQPLFWVGFALLALGGALYALQLARGFIKPAQRGTIVFDSARPIDKTRLIMGERTTPLALKAGQTMRVSYKAAFRSGAPVLRLVREDRLGRELGVAGEIPLNQQGAGHAALPIDSESLHVVEFKPQGLKGRVEVSWVFE